MTASTHPRDPEPVRSHQLRVERTARYHVLGDLESASAACWIALHGYGQLASELLRDVAVLAGPGRVVVAPEALSRFYLDRVGDGAHAKSRVGASWMTREDREAEIRDYVEYLDRLRGAVPRGAGTPVHVLGFSQGVATAVRWAVLGDSAPPATLVLWAGQIPDEIDSARARERLADTDLVLVTGAGDRFVSPDLLRAQAARLGRAGFRVREAIHPGGHEIAPDLLERLVADLLADARSPRPPGT